MILSWGQLRFLDAIGSSVRVRETFGMIPAPSSIPHPENDGQGESTMRSLSIYHLNELLAPSSPPCISLYQPTHRHHPDNQQDPIRFRNLVTEAESSLRQKYAN